MYYKLPLSFNRTVECKDLYKCDLLHSIDQHIALILFTGNEEHRTDNKFGCLPWDFDFELMVDKSRYENELSVLLHSLIERREKRLKDICLQVNIEQIEKWNALWKFYECKNRAHITIQAVQVHNSAPYTYTTDIYLGPLSS